MFKVIEKFVSIDGEGPTSGELATFIRFSDCNLRCSWCDTSYSWDGSSCVENVSAQEIYEYIKQSKTKNVTLTGGEPLLQPNLESLLDLLVEDETLTVHIESNGSINLSSLKMKYQGSQVQFVLDYKLPTSQMSSRMCHDNFDLVEKTDVYKFVIASQIDLQTARSIIQSYELNKRCQIYFSPVADLIHPSEVVDFMRDYELIDVRLQLQLHKFIWPKEMRGV